MGRGRGFKRARQEYQVDQAVSRPIYLSLRTFNSVMATLLAFPPKIQRFFRLIQTH
jgi:hypothetical protein